MNINEKRSLVVIIIMAFILVLGFLNFNFKGLDFKLDYEEINNKKNSYGKINRSVSISSNNKFKEITPKSLIKKIDNKETFYVYFGSKLCPWCRSVIEVADEVSRKNKIDKIYYVDIWDNDGNEIFRDKYEIKDGKAKLVKKGTKEYYKLLNIIGDLLSDYELTNESEKISVREKRIYAPNFVYFKDGKAVRLVEGVSKKQEDSREKLTKEIIKDENKIFNKFFKK